MPKSNDVWEANRERDEQPQPFVSNLPKKGAVGQTFAPVAGFGITLRNFFRPTVTEQYPRVKTPPMPRYHGRHQLNRHPDGLEKCIGCELCAWACPADAIYVEGDSNTPDNQVSPGERYGRVYQINYLRCIFCAMCIEACPTRALTMTNEYELAGPTREGMIYEKQDLLAPMGKNMLAAPHPMVPGTTDDNYYRREVTEPVEEQIEWVREHRPDDPTLPENRQYEAPEDDDNERNVPRNTAATPDQGAPAAAMRHSMQKGGLV